MYVFLVMHQGGKGTGCEGGNVRVSGISEGSGRLKGEFEEDTMFSLILHQRG